MKYLKPFKVNESSWSPTSGSKRTSTPKSMIDDWTVKQLIEMLTIELEDSKHFNADIIYLSESDIKLIDSPEILQRYPDGLDSTMDNLEQEVASLKLNQLKVVSICILQKFTHGLVKDMTDEQYKLEDGKSLAVRTGLEPDIYTVSQLILQPEIAKIDKTVLDKIGRKYDFDVTIDRVSPWDYEKCEYEVKFTINTY